MRFVVSRVKGVVSLLAMHRNLRLSTLELKHHVAAFLQVRIRLSTLEGNKVYRGSFPLYLLGKKGVTPMGSLDLAIRLTYPSSVPILKQYLKPVLPAMHYLAPINKDAAETLRIAAMNLVADSLEKYDPPLRRETVEYMLDTDEMLFTMRRMRANWNRIKVKM